MPLASSLTQEEPEHLYLGTITALTVIVAPFKTQFVAPVEVYVQPEPLMVAASINRQCLTHEYITDSKVFTVSILSQEVPMSFIGDFGFKSGRNTDKFERVRYKMGQTSVPIILDNTVAFLEAEVTESIDVITHTLFIAKVVACETLDEDAEPMTYNYYRDIKHGRTPKTAATYIKVKPKAKLKEE